MDENGDDLDICAKCKHERAVHFESNLRRGDYKIEGCDGGKNCKCDGFL